MIGSRTSSKSSKMAVRPHRSVGDLVFDVTVEEVHEDELTITEHPVEQGAEISDHAYKNPETVTIRAGITDCKQDGGKPSSEFYEKLLELQKKREPMDVVTGKRMYENMLIQSISETTDNNTENALMVTMTLRQVHIVETKVTSVPPSTRHKNPAKTGGVSDKGEKQGKQRTSILAAGTGKGKIYKPGV